MATLNEHHRPKAGIEGKCSVPTWAGGLPAGFCDRPAWGEQRTPRNRFDDLPMAHGYCCEAHGGPGPNDIRFMRDGDAWMAFEPDFVNLQEGLAGFGSTRKEALADLRAAISKATGGGE